MRDEPSLAIRLFGTDEPVAASTLLQAGPLSARFEAGNLRHIRMHGKEVLRAVSFIVRDKDWGTCQPVLSGLSLETFADRFNVRYAASVTNDGQDFSYEAQIEGRADGKLIFSGKGSSKSGFLTNRTGFVILHPIDGVAGSPVTITHTDGSVVEGRFPALIDPVQPMMDLRALAHVTPDGLTVLCRMEGDTYEMEDQRNWTDASYKTYVRPLALPWPYRLEPGETVQQCITVTIGGVPVAHAGQAHEAISVGNKLGPFPALGQGLHPQDAGQALALVDKLSPLGLAHLILHYDPRQGHDRGTLEQQIAVAQNMRAQPWLEAVITSVDGFADEVAGLGQIAHDLGDPFKVVLVSPAPDMKCTLPGSIWPATPDAAALYTATRKAFPHSRIGGGMFSYFTELNRKRPPVAALDLVSFTTCPMVHAGDDHSVMETAETYPAIIASVESFAGSKPIAVGPSAIGMRDNPYGAEAKANPGNIRQAMNANDPRQRGLFGAVWALAYIAGFARGGAEAIALGAPVGPFGVVSVPLDIPQPWFADHGGVYPAYHILKGLARHKGEALHALSLPDRSAFCGLAIESPDGTEIWIGNLRPEPVEVRLGDAGPWQGAMLDAESFVEASRDPTFMDRTTALTTSAVHLKPYAVLRLHHTSRP